MFFPRRESAGPIEYFFHFIGVGKVYWISKTYMDNHVFFLRENVLCVAYPVGVQMRLFPFIEFWVRIGISDFKIYLLERPFFFLKMFHPPKGDA